MKILLATVFAWAAFAQSPLPPKIPNDQVVAKIDGKDVTAGDVYDALLAMPPEFVQLYNRNPQYAVQQLFMMQFLSSEADKYQLAEKAPYKQQLKAQRDNILAGALLGMGTAFLSTLASVRSAARSALNYLYAHPKYLYCLLFVWTFELGEMFDSVRHIGVLGVKIALKYPRRFEELAASLVVGGLLCVLAWHMWRKDHSAPDHAWPTVRHR